ncbi:MAG TPA: hypothetical protein ENJ50_09925, partial [Planctomycetaceae bacterium]|nr:hypothetical protein [Planctomycetaceae bacterium]
MVNLADRLVNAGLTRERLEECRRIVGVSGESLDRVIVQKDYMPEAEVLGVYAAHLGYEFREKLEGTKVPNAFVDGIPIQFTRNYNLIAVGEPVNGVMSVATCAPLDPNPMDDLSAMLGFDIEPVLATKTEITTLIARAYRHKADGVDEALDAVSEDADIAGLAEELDDSEDVLDVS